MDFERRIEYYQKVFQKNLRNFFSQLKFKELPNLLIKEEIILLKNFCLRPGKKIRPILALAVFKALSSRSEKDIFFPLLTLELYHNSTLIHDDIYDEDIFRRGDYSYHYLFQRWFKKRYQNPFYFGNLYRNSEARFGVVAGFIGGKILRTLVNRVIFQSKIPPEKKYQVWKLFANQDISDNFGQAIDLFFEKEEKITPKDYFEMTRLKTAGLFQIAVELGAILAEANQKQRRILRNYAENLAVAFQIKDDLLDLSIGGEKGRGIGSDIKKGKKTLLLISALKKARPAERKELLKVISQENKNPSEIKKIINFYHRTGAVKICQRAAYQKIKKAIFWLNHPQLKIRTKEKKFLKDLSYFMVERKK